MPTFKNISKKGEKKWSVVFDLPTDDGTRKQKRLSGFSSHSEANLAYISFMADYKIPKTKLINNKTFQKTFNIYLETIKYSVKESTYICIESDFRNHILPYFKDKLIQAIKSLDVNEWLIALSKKELSHRTKTKIKAYLTRFFNYCIDNDIIEINPCKKAITLKNTETKKEMLIWSEEEFKKFISVVVEIEYKIFFSFLYLTGCRIGEVLALNWTDLNNNTIKINKSLSYRTKNSVYSITSPKNYYSNRDVVIPSNLIKALNKLKEHYQKYENFNDNNFIFGNYKPLPAETIRRKKNLYCQKAQVKQIRLHDFRHSHASLLISKGHDIVTISRRLGHADIEMTLNRYAHLMPNKQNKLLKSLNNINI